VLEPELLEVVEGGGAEPAIQGRHGGIPHAVAVWWHDETAAMARVRREDARDIAGEDAAASWVVVEVEIERSGAP